METYKNSLGDVLTVTSKGKGFTTTQNRPGTKRVAPEIRVRNHRSYSAVEKLIARFGYIAQ